MKLKTVTSTKIIPFWWPLKSEWKITMLRRLYLYVNFLGKQFLRICF